MLPEDWREQRIRRFDADREVAPIEDGLQRRDPAAIEAALAYLEADPPGFRTGYAKQRLLRRLRGQDVGPPARARICALVLRAADDGFRDTTREYRHLARKHATNELRRELRARLHAPDPRVAWRATLLLDQVRRPRLSDADIAAARDAIRVHVDQSRSPWIDRRLIARFWSAEWEADLDARARDDRDLGARRLLEEARQFERVREWRASKRRQSATPSAEARSEDEL